MTDVPVAPPPPPETNQPFVPTATPPQVAQTLDLTAYVDKYIQIRDKISEMNKEFDEKLRPLKEAKGALEGVFGEQLTKLNTKSMKTAAGTITATERGSATVEDMLAFRKFVQEMGEWELADVRANAPAVKEYAETNKQWPPGVKYSAIYTISVRRASS
jgi:hypothetical protein